MTTTEKSVSRKSRKLILIVVLGIGVLAGLIGVLMPLAMSDGLERYKGAEREVARLDLMEFGYPNRGIDALSHLNELKFRVESITPVDPADVGCMVEELPLNARGDYLTVISRRTFFGIQDQVIVVTPCGHKIGTSVKELYPQLSL